LADKLQEYDLFNHVPSDISPDQLYLPSESIKMQRYVSEIENWSKKNLMTINEEKR